MDTVVEDPSLGPVQAMPLSSLGVEELKRLRSWLREQINFVKEAIKNLDKYCRPLLPRKRSQTELSASNLSFSVDQSALGVKAWHQNHTASNCLGSQRPDKKKSTVPNKRVRTSMIDMRVEGHPNNLMNGIQHRPSTENCSKPSEGHGFRDREVLAMNKLVESAYNKHMGLQSTNVSSRKNARNKVTKRASLDFVKRTLAKCRMFEEAGKSCFSDTSLKERMLSISSKEMDKKLGDDAVEGKTANVLAKNVHALSDIKTSANCNVPSEQAAHIIDQHTQKLENGHWELCNTIQGTASFTEKNVVKDEVRSTSVKKRELQFEKVNDSGILRGATALGTTLLEGAKGKRTKRDREGKVQTKEILTRSDSTGRCQPGLGNAKVERKDKRKKTGQLSVAANDLGKPTEADKPLLTSNYCEKPSDKIVKLKDELPVSQNFIADNDGAHDNVPIDLSHLQLPNMEYFDMGSQGQDLSSWLNFEDDDLPDAAGDLMGLDVPMDDLADLNMF